MLQYVKKRDGQIVPFDTHRITNALTLANKSVHAKGGHLLDERAIFQITTDVLEILLDKKLETLDINTIQDAVVTTLIKSNYRDMATEYIEYRYKRDRARDVNSYLMTIIQDLILKDSKDFDLKRENANIDGNCMMGIMLREGSEVSKRASHLFLLKPEVSKAHLDGLIHIHDLDFYDKGGLNCIQIDLTRLFENGFNTGHGYLRKPGNIVTAMSLAAIAIQSNQNDMFGGQSIAKFDYDIAPYVSKTFIKHFNDVLEVSDYDINPVEFFQKRIDEKKSLLDRDCFLSFLSEFGSSVGKKDAAHFFKLAHKRTNRSTYQAAEAFIHNMNTLQCIPHSEKIWVFDKKKEELMILSIGKLHKIFEPHRYQAFSLNRKTKDMELKDILAVQRKDNHRRLVTIRTTTGQYLTMTDNHKVLTLDSECNIDMVKSEDVQALLMPRKFSLPRISNKIDLTKYGCAYSTTVYQGDVLEVNEDLAELLGYYVGDGSTSEGTLHIGTCSKVDPSYMRRLAYKAFGVKFKSSVSYYYSNTTHRNEIRSIDFVVGQRISKAIRDIAGYSSITKHIPNCIMLGTKAMQIRFLNAYFLCDSRHAKYIEVTSISRILIQQVALLILSFGECPYLAEALKVEDRTNTTYIESKHDLYGLVLGGKACERMGIKTYGKIPTFEIPKYKSKHVVDMLRNKFRLTWAQLPHKARTKTSRNRKGYCEGTISYGQLSDVMDKQNITSKAMNYVDKVFSVGIDKKIIGNSDREYVYDISVDTNENLLAGDSICICNSRAGSQVPFSSINYGTDTSPEGRMVIKNILYAQNAGLGKGETPIFPIHIFKVKDGISGNPGDPNYDLFQLACKVSGKRLFPNFTFIDAPFNKQYYKEGNPDTESATMGCRTRVVGNIDKDNEVFTSRGNLSFTSINLPRLAILSDHNVSTFFRKLDETLDLVVTQLLDRFEFQAQKKAKNFPFLMGQNIYLGSEKLKPEDSIREVIKHGTLTIGYIGLAECLVALIGKHHGESKEAQELGLKIVSHIRQRTDEETKKRNLNFSCIGSPAEGLCLASDTQIMTADGLRCICDIKVGDFVYTVNETTSKVELDEVVKSGQTFPMHKVLEVKAGGHSIICTPEHPFAVSCNDGFKYVEANDLKAWDILYFGQAVISVTPLENPVSVYDISMKHNHNFLVGRTNGGLDDCILVHNSGRFVDLDKKKFGIIPGVTDRMYYTNSNHVPVYYNISATEKIDIEAPYHALTNGGHISYVEVTGDIASNPKAFEDIVQYMKKAGIGYGSINHPVDRDPVCGYVGVIGDTCPRCGRREGEEISEERWAEIQKFIYSVDSDVAEDDSRLDELYSIKEM